MILILGEGSSKTINTVISYLEQNSFRRFNDSLPISSININSKVCIFDNEGQFEISSVWYYRSYLRLSEIKIYNKITASEYSVYLEYLLNGFKDKVIGSYHDFFHQNTLIQLAEADRVGLLIPKTVLSRSLPDFGESRIRPNRQK
ncbi:MAG: hypothetical protein R2771_13350 [Saprospiraceae bacterium]